MAALRAEVEALKTPAEITVERINVVEDDGTVRLVISNRRRAPDPIIGGKAGKRRGGNQAGMVFYNADGDECGGLIFWGGSGNGHHGQGGGLLFDQYRQDQVCGILHEDLDGRRSAGLRVWDRPDRFLDDVMAERAAAIEGEDGPDKLAALQQLRDAGTFGRPRMFVGKTADASALVELRDASGVVRLRLVVGANGTAAIEFLDESGEVTHHLP